MTTGLQYLQRLRYRSRNQPKLNDPIQDTIFLKSQNSRNSQLLPLMQRKIHDSRSILKTLGRIRTIGQWEKSLGNLYHVLLNIDGGHVQYIVCVRHPWDDAHLWCQIRSASCSGITMYLLGLAVGSLLLAPLSEMYGRRPVYLISIFLFTVLIIPCALANNLAQVLVFRFLGAIAGAAMISNAPGTVNDIVSEEYRAFSFSVWSLGPMNGVSLVECLEGQASCLLEQPVIGPVIGGFVFESLGWRFTAWVPMIGAAVSWFLVFSIPETYAPSLLRAKAIKRRKETQDDRWYSRYDDKRQFWPLLRENLTRPFSMAIFEPICIFWNLYIALVYGVLYLCFVSYPIVFGELRGWSPGFVGLSYTGIGIGGVSSSLHSIVELAWGVGICTMRSESRDPYVNHSHYITLPSSSSHTISIRKPDYFGSLCTD